MALRKCPKCELNYIKDGEEFCNVCMREMRKAVAHIKHDDEDAEVLMCSECGEAPAVRGTDLCAECLKEKKRQADLENATGVDSDFDDLDVEEEDLEDDVGDDVDDE